MVKVSSVLKPEDIPEELIPVLEEFGSVFPEKLPDGLPPQRLVEFEMEMKPEAIPSSRAPFRLSKTEQDALEIFIKENLKKEWIEVSISPWVSNIFGIPKKDPATGTIPKRAEWLRSGNHTMPIRWVIDFRYVNSQTKTPKIPLPLIEELFDKMLGCAVFTVIDLAQGYHQMRVATRSRQYTAFSDPQGNLSVVCRSDGTGRNARGMVKAHASSLDKFPFVVVYLDDICIFSKSMKEHAEHPRAVCDVLKHEKLYAHLSKAPLVAQTWTF